MTQPRRVAGRVAGGISEAGPPPRRAGHANQRNKRIDYRPERIRDSALLSRSTGWPGGFAGPKIRFDILVSLWNASPSNGKLSN
jgi:hypothetical protein